MEIQFHDYLVEFLLDGSTQFYNSRAMDKVAGLHIARRCLVADGFTYQQVKHEAIAEVVRA